MTDYARYFDARARTSVLKEVDGQRFDLVIIGGGINGAGCAHDAASRGLKVLLLEQRDLAFGTSSRSSKLIHGGLRYLEHYQFKLVFEGTNERAALRSVAPHLVRPLMFALPVYEDDRVPLWLMDVGLWMYDSLSLFKVEKRHITLRSPKRMLEREPLLNPEKLTGGIIYYDCMTDDARLTLENAMTASQLGSPVITRARVTGVQDSGASPVAVTFEDRLSGRECTVYGRGVVNCTGVWTDRLRKLVKVDDQIVRPTKGVHLVLRQERLPVHSAVALVAPQDGRVFFAIPWKGRTVIGTTDTDFSGDPSEIPATRADADYLLAAANHHFPGQDLQVKDAIAAWAGLRPLINAQVESESDVPREHKHYRDGRMITVAGGKLTTYRRMAAETIDHAINAAELRCGPSKTEKSLLPGARGLSRDFDEEAQRISAEAQLEPAIAKRLVDIYGSRSAAVIELLQENRGWAERICPDREVILAEVVHAVRNELALTLEDVLIRRTSLSLTSTHQALDAEARVAALMAEELGWSPQQTSQHRNEFRGAVELTRQYRA